VSIYLNWLHMRIRGRSDPNSHRGFQELCKGVIVIVSTSRWYEDLTSGYNHFLLSDFCFVFVGLVALLWDRQKYLIYMALLIKFEWRQCISSLSSHQHRKNRSDQNRNTISPNCETNDTHNPTKHQVWIGNGFGENKEVKEIFENGTGGWDSGNLREERK